MSSIILNKRAQIKNFETIAVLVVFFFLLIFGISFYSRIQFDSFEKQRAKSADVLTINLALKTGHMPELGCVLTGITKENCIDLLKVEELADLMEKPDSLTRQTYFQMFKNSVIEVFKLNEFGEIDETYVLYNNTDPNAKNIPKMRLPIKIFDPVKKTNSFGYMEVTIYA